MKANDIMEFLYEHKPKIHWECSEDMLLALHQIRDTLGHRLLLTTGIEPANSDVASGTLLGLPIHVYKSMTADQLRLLVNSFGQEVGYEFTPPCECKDFKLHRADCGAPTGVLICLECGEPSSEYKVVKQ